VDGSCEDGNEPSGSIECWEILQGQRLAASQEGLGSVELVPLCGIIKKRARLRLDLSNGPNRIGASHPFTRGRKQIRFPERCVL
jgi:hypothetical protein